MAAGLDLDAWMERASRALVGMDYFECEALCVEALAEARRRGLWGYYARIVLPLQEARRQRRMAACDGVVLINTVLLPIPRLTLGPGDAGCYAVMPPQDFAFARRLEETGRRARIPVEVLWLEWVERDPDVWEVGTFSGPRVRCRVDGPATEDLADDGQPPGMWPMLCDWVRGGNRHQSAADRAENDDRHERAVRWWLRAHEALGDAAIAAVDEGGAALGTVERVDALAAMVEAVADHEKLHQRLAEAAAAVEAGDEGV